MTLAASGMKKQVSAATHTTRMLGPAAAAIAVQRNAHSTDDVEERQIAESDATLECGWYGHVGRSIAKFRARRS